MDVRNVNPFIQSFEYIMPQLGFGSVRMGNIGVAGKGLVRSGIIILVGIVGELKGNVVYNIDMEAAKKIASTMMMGMPVNEIDGMAKSALQELSNMLSANAATFFSRIGVLIDISTPTLLQGDDVSIKINAEQVLSLQLFADDIPVEVNIAYES